MLLAWVLVFSFLPFSGGAFAHGAQAPWPDAPQSPADSRPILATDEAVEQFLLANGGQLGKSIAPGNNGLRLVRKLASPDGETHYIYQQQYRDVPVYGKYAKIRLDRERRPAYVDNGLALELGSRQMGTAPAISERQAIEALVRDAERAAGIKIDTDGTLFGKPAFHAEAEKVLVPRGGDHLLAWHVSISYLLPEAGSWSGFVDAASGAVIDKYGKRYGLSQKNRAFGKGTGNLVKYGEGEPAGPVEIYHDRDGEIDETSPDYYLLDVSRPMFRESGDEDEGVIVTYHYEEDYLYWIYSLDTEFDHADGLDAHYLAGEVYDFFLGEFGWNSFDGQGTTVTNIVYYPAEDTAFWLSGLNVFVYGMKNQFNCISCSGEIVAHEFAHGVIDAIAGLEYRNQPGALHESFADVLAAAFSRDGDPWIIGGSEIGVAIRDLANPAGIGYPGHMDDYWHAGPDDDQGGIHINSSIPSLAAYKIARGIEDTGLLSGKLAGAPGADGIGRRALGQIAFRALHYLTPTDEFQDARDAYIQAAADFAAALGLDASDAGRLVQIVRKAWQEVGLGANDVQLNIRDVEVPFATWLSPVIDQATRTVDIGVPAGLDPEQLEVNVLASSGAHPVPNPPAFGRDGTSVVRIVYDHDPDMYQSWTLRAVHFPAVYYHGDAFEESTANDGSIGNTIVAELYGDVFTGPIGEDYVENGKLSFGNVPAGLTLEAEKIDDAKVEIRLAGRAQQHAAKDSISDLWVYFAEGAFASIGQLRNGHTVTHLHIFHHAADIPVVFDDPAPSPQPGPSPGPVGPIIVPPVTPPAEEDGEPEAVADGVVIGVAQPSRTDGEDGSRLTAEVDGDKLAAAFGMLAEREDGPQAIIVQLDETADTHEVAFPADALAKGMETAPAATLSIRAGAVTYDVPLAALDPAKLATALQAGGAADTRLVVAISRVTGEMRLRLIGDANASRMQVIGDAYDFRVALAIGEQTAEISRFAGPVTRTVAIAGNHVGQTAVVRYDPANGRFAFVPAAFAYADGKMTVTFTRNSNSVYAVVKYTPVFADLANHWAREEIEQLALRQIVSGISADAFQPNGRVTRAQFAAMLVNALDLQASGAETPFADIDPGAWHAAYVAAGVEAGLFSGFQDGTFRPNDPISREQMAVMLAKAMAVAGAEAPVANADGGESLPFTDRDAISDWAAGAVAKAVRAGLLFGKSDGRFAPQDPATRAEAAAIVARLLHQLEI